MPGDKSISHRVGLLAGIAKGTSVVRGYLRSEDCLNTLYAMEALGAGVEDHGDGGLRIRGAGGSLQSPASRLDMGNSGTGIRLLAGLLAGRNLDATLVGDASLMSRPMGRIRDPLTLMGANVVLEGEGGRAPVVIHGTQLKGIEYPLPVASAQVKSCVLLAGMHAEGETVVIEPAPTRDHTEAVLRKLGLDLEVDGLHIRVRGYGPEGPAVEGCDWVVPGDFSSAAFWLVAAAAAEGRSLTIQNVGLNPRRTGLLEVLKRMGARIEAEVDPAAYASEPYGTIHIEGQSLQGTEVGGAEIPNVIDELPLVAVLGALAEGRTVIRDAAELRVKESDRIQAMTDNLRQVGVEVEDTPDGMIIEGPAALKPAGICRSLGDHRIAMAMAVLGLYSRESISIQDIQCTETSYPGFWDMLAELGGQLD